LILAIEGTMHWYNNLLSDGDKNGVDVHGGDGRKTRNDVEKSPRQSSDETTPKRPLRFPLYETLMTLVGLASVVFVLLGALLYYLSDDYFNPHVFFAYRVAYWVAMIVAMLFGCRVSRDRMTTTVKSGIEYMVLFSCVGPIVQVVFTMMVNLHTSDQVCPTVLCFLEEGLNLLEVIIQTLFYFWAKKVTFEREKTVHSSDVETTQHETQKKAKARLKRDRTIFKAVVLMMTVCNGVMWVEDSFVETRNIEKSFQGRYYKNWKYIYNLTNPVLLFYRFNSMMLFLNVYLKQK
jgi:hypothetical protein